MNKVFAGVVVGLALGAASAVSALDASVGFGGFFAGDFGAGLMGYKYSSSEDQGGPGYPLLVEREGETSAPWYGGGFNVFVDATYIEIGVGLTFVGSTINQTSTYRLNGVEQTRPADYEEPTYTVSGTYLNTSLLLKYPVALGAMNVFPAAGFDYATGISGTETRSYKGESETRELLEPGNFGAFWIKFGGGLDFSFTESIFLRSVLLYGIRFSNQEEYNVTTEWERDGQGNSTGKRVKSDGYDTKLGHGLTLRVGVGFKI